MEHTRFILGVGWCSHIIRGLANIVCPISNLPGLSSPQAVHGPVDSQICYRTVVGTYSKPKKVPEETDCASDSVCLSRDKFPILKNVRNSLIDPDTPRSAYSKKGIDGTYLKLVVSKIRPDKYKLLADFAEPTHSSTNHCPFIVF